MAQWVKNLPARKETPEMQVPFLGWEHPLEKEMATHSSILALEIHPMDRGAWQATVHRVEHDLATEHTHTCVCIYMIFC